MNKFFTIICTMLAISQCMIRRCYGYGPYPAGSSVPVYESVDNGPWQATNMFVIYPYNGPLHPGLWLEAYALVPIPPLIKILK